MNPYPLAPLNQFTVPFSLTRNSFHLDRKLTFARSVELMLRTTPSEKTKALPAGTASGSHQQEKLQRLGRGGNHGQTAGAIVCGANLDCRTQAVNPKRQPRCP